MSTIFELCDNDISKIDDVTSRRILEVLNWLSYHKEKNDLKNNKNNDKNF